MKRTLLTLSAIVMVALMTACGGNKQEQPEAVPADKQEVVKAGFYCPMKCEGEKTYAEAGTCPSCGMDLVQKTDAE